MVLCHYKMLKNSGKLYVYSVFSRNHNPIRYSYKIKDTPLQNVNKIKDLGIIL